MPLTYLLPCHIYVGRGIWSSLVRLIQPCTRRLSSQPARTLVIYCQRFPLFEGLCNTWHIIYIVMNYSILKHILYSLNRSACSIYLSNLHYNTNWWVLMYTNKLRHRRLCTNPRNKVSSHLNICISGKTLLVH